MPSIARHHNEWLSLIEVSGPFLSLPVLLRVFPQGLEKPESSTIGALRSVAAEWEDRQHDRAIHTAWVRYVLHTLLELPDDVVKQGPTLPPNTSVRIAEHGETLQPDFAVVDLPEGDSPGKARLLVQIVPPDQDLERPITGKRWGASPATRMTELLHGADVRLGLVTNGEQWMLVDAPRGETTGYASWYTSLWLDEPLTLQAFRTLLSAHRFFGVAPDDTLEALLTASAADQQEVTDQLGRQVRTAVEILIQALDRIDKDSGGTLLEGASEKRLYESALTVMMRLVFLLSAEERGLMLLGNPLYDQFYAVSTLWGQLREAADQYGEEVLERRHDAYSRLLATFRAVHSGIDHDLMHLPPYGGTLFDPDRFPFLEGRPSGTGWQDTPAVPLQVHNRTVLHLLEALQWLQVRMPGGGPMEARRLSFRALDIEQIGHVYEGLLDHTAVRATEPVLGLRGSAGKEPEVTLAALERSCERGEDALVALVKDATGRTDKSIRKDLAADQPLDERRLLAACENDEALLQRARPFAGLLRLDSSSWPVVITTGSVYVTQGSDRRSTGTHYTPRSLTEPIVRYTLEPLVYHGPAEGEPREAWRLRTARELLDLKVCDMAMGSGAFLVQTCRWLAERLTEAWAEVEAAHPEQVVITPEGDLSTGGNEERPMPRDAEERLAIAQRLVADRCLYGVDINPMAVEMAKLSLWLVTMQRDRPFTFLDHALRHGDSLLGITTVDQLASWNLATGTLTQNSVFRANLETPIRAALRLRRRIESMPEVTAEDTQAKARLLAEAEAATDLARLGADLLTGTALLPAKQQATRRNEILARFQVLLVVAEDRKQGSYKEHVHEGDRAQLRSFREEASTLLQARRPFHWPLEFPEVFVDESTLSVARGFDALVGNPPFMGGQKITGNLGTDYRDYLVERIGRGQRGSADLCAYFFLRGRQLLRLGGGFGMLATNTIAQGDTREVGLEQLVEDDCVIPRAVASRKWPGIANLEVAHVWVRRGEWAGEYELDDQRVTGVSPFLVSSEGVQGKPYRLAANAGKSFQGSIVLSMGFVLSPEEAHALIEKDARNGEVLFPYLNGEDLNSRPDQSPSRWVINFHDWPLERAETYVDCMAIVREKVKPERDLNNRKIRRERWWQFAERAPELYKRIAGMERVLVTAAVSKYISVAWELPVIIFSHALVVFSLGRDEDFAILASSFHEAWARQYGSSLETRFRYTPSDCFDTFPLPQIESRSASAARKYYSRREQLIQLRHEGTTKLYNALHDSREISAPIQLLRDAQQLLDQAVVGAYGWNELNLDHGFHATKQGVRFAISEAARREVLARLLELNHQRYAEEVREGLHEQAQGVLTGKRARKAAAPSLFDEAAS